MRGVKDPSHRILGDLETRKKTGSGWGSIVTPGRELGARTTTGSDRPLAGSNVNNHF